MKRDFGIITTFILLLMIITMGSCKNKGITKEVEIRVKKEKVLFLASDSLPITADLYMHQNKTSAPFIILFHQAGYSRGEYGETADKFIELGYNVLAVDQRSGGEVNGILNETHMRAVELNKETSYTDAMPDLLAAIKFVTDSLEADKPIILGSSYSSVLSLIIASKYPEKVKGVLAFSPGNYFEYQNRTIIDYAKNISIPVFITSAKSEQPNWKDIYEAIPAGNKQSYIPIAESMHGSRALWNTTEGNVVCWESVKQFLQKIE